MERLEADNSRQLSRETQGHSQKFVLEGIKVFGGIKLLNSRSDVIFTP